MYSTILVVQPKAFEMNSPTGYAIGAVIALIILGYLVFSLVKPEKF
jgi:K+-transporting ATPase KdpF subunit